MSVLVMGMLDDIRFGLRRASNAQAMAQAQWYALGAESLAMAQIDRLSTRAGAQAGLAGLEQRPLVFPIEHGMIRARLSDETACFNLNSVVEGTGELWQRRESGSRAFTALMLALGGPQVQAEALDDRGSEESTYA